MSRKVKFVSKEDEAKKMKRRKWISAFVVVAVLLTVAVLANMAMIFFFSSESREESGDRSADFLTRLLDIFYPGYDEMGTVKRYVILNKVHKLIRKVAHFTEFCLLGFLSTGLLLFLNHRKRVLKIWLEWCIPVAFCLLYAISDEVHQIFTNRGASVRDVLIDFAGALTGIVIMQGIVGLTRIVKRRRERSCKTPATV